MINSIPERRTYNETENQKNGDLYFISAFSRNYLVFFPLPDNKGGIGTYHQRKLYRFYDNAYRIDVPGQSLVRISVSGRRTFRVPDKVQRQTGKAGMAR